MLCFSFKLYIGDFFQTCSQLFIKQSLFMHLPLKISSEWRKGVWSTVDYTQQVAGDFCVFTSLWSRLVCVCVFWELTNCKMLLCCCTICTVDSVQQAGHQSLAAILHLRPHFTAAFHVLPVFTMFGPTLHVMKRKVLYSGVKISSLVQGVS